MAGQLIARGDRKWQIKVFLGRRPNGKRRYYTKTLHGTKKEARRILNEKLHEQDNGLLVLPSKRSVKDFLIKWIDTGKPGISPRTRASYRWTLLHYVLPRLGDFRLDQLTPLQVQALYRGMTGRGLSPRSVRYTHSVLRQALTQAVRWRLLATNPTDHVELPKQDRKEMRALSADEAGVFLDFSRGDRWEALWELLLVTGLRPSEALGLRWADVDWKSHRLRVQRALVKGENGVELAEPKTARGRRSVVLPVSAVETLRAHRARSVQARLKAGVEYDAATDLVFATRVGKPLDYSNLVRQHFKPIVRAAGLEPLRVYDLRHTCATLLLAGDEHPKVVAERLGHASIVMTLDVYSHVMPDMQEGAAKKLEEMLFRKPDSATAPPA